MPTELYEILGVEITATENEIRRAYKKLALKYHPDKASPDVREENEAKFKEITEAYEVLCDEERRKIYDLGGGTNGRQGGSHPGGYGDFDFDFEFGGPNGMGGHDFDADDFANFFGAGMGGHNSTPRSKPKKNLNIVFETKVTLTDLYTGRLVKETFNRNVKCAKCTGTGLRKKAVEIVCPTCEGKGQVQEYKRMPGMGGMVFIDHVECKNCEGKGKYARPDDRCRKCKGKCVVSETHTCEFNIKKGSPVVGSVVEFQNGHVDAKDGRIGDAILNYTMVEDMTDKESKFKRSGDDLYTKISITLIESLGGFEHKSLIQTIDGRWLHVKVPTGKVIRPGDCIVIKGEGMPIVDTNRSGDLYVGVEIVFPKDGWMLEKNDVNKLSSLLGMAKVSTNNNGEKNDNASNEEDEEITSSTVFTIKDKHNVPKSFNSYVNDTEVKTFGKESSNSWFGWNWW